MIANRKSNTNQALPPFIVMVRCAKQSRSLCDCFAQRTMITRNCKYLTGHDMTLESNFANTNFPNLCHST
jgi:hypothetical protein